MGIVQTAQCDVYKTFSEVEQYEIVLRRIGDPPDLVIQQWEPYLSRRALRRAVHFIERGITAPPERTEKISGQEKENTERAAKPESSDGRPAEKAVRTRRHSS